MASHFRIFISWTLATVSIGYLTACRNGDASSARQRTDRDSAVAPAPATSLTGTLRSGVAAIGGETTGWRLVGDGATGGFDVDVSKLQSRAKAMDGKRVTVTGRMTTKPWPERGDTPVLMAEKIEPADSAGDK